MCHLKFKVEDLKQALESFLKEGSDVHALEILLARDALQSELATDEKIPPETLIQISDIDLVIINNQHQIYNVLDLENLRRSFHPPESHWWWFLEKRQTNYEKWDWLWNSLNIASLAISVSLMVDISSRFLAGGIDTIGSFTVVSQSILALVTVKGSLTDAGEKVIENSFKAFAIKRYFWQEFKFGLSVLLLMLMLTTHRQLPRFSNYFNWRGLNQYISGELSNAQMEYERAIALNSNNAIAHYNLGRLYENLQQTAEAETQYRLAASAGLKAAYNELSRLYIQNEQFSESAVLINQTLQAESVQNDKFLLYALYKNLGWARLKQERFKESQGHLEMAISLEEELIYEDPDYSTAAAYCLLAQVLEAQSQDSLAMWMECLARASVRSVEEDIWTGLAKERVDKLGNTP